MVIFYIYIYIYRERNKPDDICRYLVASSNVLSQPIRTHIVANEHSAPKQVNKDPPPYNRHAACQIVHGIFPNPYRPP